MPPSSSVLFKVVSDPKVKRLGRVVASFNQDVIFLSTIACGAKSLAGKVEKASRNMAKAFSALLLEVAATPTRLLSVFTQIKSSRRVANACAKSFPATAAFKASFSFLRSCLLSSISFLAVSSFNSVLTTDEGKSFVSSISLKK